MFSKDMEEEEIELKHFLEDHALGHLLLKSVLYCDFLSKTDRAMTFLNLCKSFVFQHEHQAWYNLHSCAQGTHSEKSSI